MIYLSPIMANLNCGAPYEYELSCSSVTSSALLNIILDATTKNHNIFLILKNILKIEIQNWMSVKTTNDFNFINDNC